MDFSMPYNAMTLVSTVAAFAIGASINVLARKPRKKAAAGPALQSSQRCSPLTGSGGSLRAWLRCCIGQQQAARAQPLAASLAAEPRAGA